MTSILSQEKRVSNVTSSNAIITRSKNICEFFFPFAESTWNLEYFERKDEPQSLFVSEIKDCKKRSYLNAQKAPCQNVYGQSTS